MGLPPEIIDELGQNQPAKPDARIFRVY